MTFTCILYSDICLSICGIMRCLRDSELAGLGTTNLRVKGWRTSSFSSRCFSSASFSIMLACASLVSSSFSFRSLCLKTFSRFCKAARDNQQLVGPPALGLGSVCGGINTASRWSYLEMSPLSFSARALFSWHSLVLRLLCSSIWA